jgi:hypothetical protein
LSDRFAKFIQSRNKCSYHHRYYITVELHRSRMLPLPTNSGALSEHLRRGQAVGAERRRFRALVLDRAIRIRRAARRLEQPLLRHRRQTRLVRRTHSSIAEMMTRQISNTLTSFGIILQSTCLVDFPWEVHCISRHISTILLTWKLCWRTFQCQSISLDHLKSVLSKFAVSRKRVDTIELLIAKSLRPI